MRINRERKGIRELGAVNKPQKIPPTAHQISPSAVSPTALEVVKTLTRSGHEAYLVGGCVRDLLLGREPKDFDVVTEAPPERVRELFRRCRLIGRRFRLAHVRVGRDVIDVATFRAAPGADDDDVDESQLAISEAGQITRDNVYGTIETDAVRRDFSINALFYDPMDETVIDYVDGFEHIENRELVSIGDPFERFREDPVRMLRAIRFSESLGLSIPDDIREAINELGSLLHHVPPARMLDEVLKLFHSGHAQAVLARLRAFGMFRYLFPFTEEAFIDGEMSIAELGLRNTDQRIQEDKPVIPAFLFACMLWDPMRDDLEKLVDSGEPPQKATLTAMEDILRDQSQYISIPKRIGFIVKDIWLLQGRLEHRSMKNVKAALAHKRFRAAYDFLLLRAEIGEVSKDLAEWWTRIQEVEADERDEMIKALNIGSRGGRNGKRRNGPKRNGQDRNAQGKSGQDRNGQGRKAPGRKGARRNAAGGADASAGDNAQKPRNGRNGKSSRRRRRRRRDAA
ncbi:MAG TPA: polynucleotide adenylyltransferase PcnB [Arenicellales bacterium]|nr:polynucleotide adenylyltransferase PcnB [Arenicellales bacterium]